MSIKPTSVAPKTLYQSITSASTSFQLNNILAWDGVTDLTSADFGTQAFGAFLSADRSRIEFFEWDPATIASASITILNRGLPFTGSVTPSASLKLDWTANDTTVLLGSDTPQFLMQMAFLASNNAFTGYNTVPDPLAATDIANKQWVLGIVNGGAVSFNQIIEAGIAGETVVAGNLLYFSETDNEWLKTDADTLATLFNVKLGIAMGAGTNGNAITGGVLTRGSYTTSGLTQGDLCYASNTAGGINSGTAGTVPRVIGLAKDATTLYFDPDFQNELYDYVVSATGNDTYTATMPGALSVPYVGMRVKLKVDVANTGQCSFNGIAIKKNVSQDLATGDVLAGQIIDLVFDGTNFQMVSYIPLQTPIVRTYTTESTQIGSSTTQFDITNPSGTTFRYTYDGTGTDPNLSLVNNPIGSLVDLQGQNFNSGNKGVFAVTGAGANYIEVTNASGVVESNVTIGTGYIAISGTTGWTKPAGLKYITLTLQGAGGGGGGAYSGGAGGNGTKGTTTSFTPNYLATGGNAGLYGQAGNVKGGVGSGGDLNMDGGSGTGTFNYQGNDSGGVGGVSFFGKSGGDGGQPGGAGGAVVRSGGGAGGGGAMTKQIPASSLNSTEYYIIGKKGTGGSVGGEDGKSGIIVVTEYYA